MEEMDKLVKLYKKLSKNQVLAGGRIFKNAVNTVWSQRNIETGKNVKFMRTHLVDDKFSNVKGMLPTDISQELLSTISASEKYRAVLKDFTNGKETRKQLLEIWTNDNLSHSVDLTALNVHGDVYTDVEFKSFIFSPDETKIMYIAEKKIANREPFYKRKSDKDDNTSNENVSTTTKGEEYVFRQDWGEQLTGKYSSVVAIYDLELDVVNILEGVPEDMCPGQVIWSPDGSSIVGIALQTEPRKLGLIYCTNRYGFIFQLDLNGTFRVLSENGKTVMSPKFSPDGKYLIWLERNANGPHHGAMKLMRLNRKELIGDSATQTNPNIVVDVIQNKISIANNKSFYGLYNTDLPERCWASDNKRLILSTPQNYTIKIYIINIESGSITELETNEADSKLSSYVLLDVFQDRLLVSRKNFCLYDQCLTTILPEEGNEDNIKWTEITDKVPIDELKDITYEYLDLEQDTNDAIKSFSAIYLGPKSGQAKQIPLIVWLHGGPHSAFSNLYALERCFFASLGFAIVFVNYRGSIGNGQASVTFLLGRVGDTDVKDCVLATKKCCEMYPWIDSERLALVGGSHGGFLVHHISGQYPDMFKAVVSRNPVIDIASMNIVSDIPDWCAVEAGFCYTQKGPINNEQLIKMREASPIQHAHKIKAATFLMLGTKDLRVPMSQGMELYYRLKTNNVPVKLNVYDDNHTLSSVPNEMDNIINGALWLMKYT